MHTCYLPGTNKGHLYKLFNKIGPKRLLASERSFMVMFENRSDCIDGFQLANAKLGQEATASLIVTKTPDVRKSATVNEESKAVENSNPSIPNLVSDTTQIRRIAEVLLKVRCPITLSLCSQTIFGSEDHLRWAELYFGGDYPVLRQAFLSYFGIIFCISHDLGIFRHFDSESEA